MIQPEILYEDAQLIICYKPAGIATQTKKLGQKDMVSILLNHVAQEGTGQPFIGVVHRLGQPGGGGVGKKPANGGYEFRKTGQQNKNFVESEGGFEYK